MAIPFANDNRQVIPRWRNSYSPAVYRELTPDSSPVTNLVDDLRKKVAEWQKYHSLSFACDLVGSSLVVGRAPEEAIAAANHILDPKSSASYSAKNIASQLLSLLEGEAVGQQQSLILFDEVDFYLRVREAKQRLHRDPGNVIAWADLSFAYAVLGLLDKSKKHINIALALSPDSRYLIRSASRLFLHARDPEHSLNILHKSEFLRFDPWLLSAEIAISNSIGRSTKYAGVAKKMIKEERFSQYNTSELNSALASLEVDNGDNKKAKKYIRSSLVDPTENAVAQAEWISRRVPSIHISANVLELPWSFEARSYDYFHQGRWKEALHDTKNWFLDEPFSPAPAINGSYISAIGLEDHNTAIGLAESGLKANPGNYKLINNLVFSLAHLNQIERAEHELSKIDPPKESPEASPILLATKGLLYFRGGDQEKGRNFYKKAVERFHELGEDELEARATLYWANEESVAASDIADSLVQRGLELAKSINREDVKTLVSRLMVSIAESKSR